MLPSHPPEDNDENVLPEWLEPFPEPLTIPLGWDLSGNPDEQPMIAREAELDEEN